jgi:serine/threonine-protein kinase
VVSPAQALRGRYRIARTFATGIQSAEMNTAVSTDCLRTGDRCMSYFHEPSGDLPMVFAGESWTWNIDADGTCPRTGDGTHLKASGQEALPQPPQDPIARLTGHGHQQQTAPCEMNADFEETITRAGD